MIKTMKKPLVILGYLIAVVLLIAGDQLTKRLAVEKLMGTSGYPIIKGVFELVYLENRGMAWGMLQGQRIFFLVITSVILLLVLRAFLISPAVKRYIPLRLTLAGLFAGAIGNLIDRTANGFVVDFFYFKLIDFPIFNVADCYVVVAGIVFSLLFLFYYKDEELSLIIPDFKKKDKHE